MQLSNESHGDELYQDAEIVKNHNHLAAKAELLKKLKDGDKELQAIAIDALINTPSFWDSVFEIGDIVDKLSMDQPALIRHSIRIGVDVFASIAAEIYDRSEELSNEGV